MRITVIPLLLIGILIISACSQNKPASQDSVQDAGLNKGQIPPDFQIKTIEGKEIKLSDFKDNKPILLYFWASWCPYCKEDLGVVKDIYPKYADKVTFLAVDLDTGEDVDLIRKYSERMKLQGIDLAQGNQQILSDYNVIYTTTKYAIGKNGAIIYKGSGVFTKEQWEVLLSGLAASS